MALFNELLHSRLNEGVRHQLDMQEHPGLQMLSPELLAVVVIPGYSHEWLLPTGQAPWSDEQVSVAVAAERSFFGLRNPAGSNLLVVVDGLRGTCPASSSHILTFGPTLATDVDATSAGVNFRDTRRAGATPNALMPIEIRGAGAAVQGTTMARTAVLANTEFDFSAGWVLSPGFELRVYCDTVNTELRGWHWGRSLSLPENDRTGA